ncbi:MAG TPA: hypothetical protein VKP13_09150 [Nitrospira sp.]|nr:hypothetical protein [Nitrospira sp.]
MLSQALVFLALGIVAGIPSLVGIIGIATHISWLLLVIGIVLLAIHLIWEDPRPKA